MLHASLLHNPFLTREDLEEAVRILYRAVAPRFSRGHARVALGAAGAQYPRSVQEMEGFCRLLWGVAPLLANHNESSVRATFLDGLVNGSNPGHPEFWGYPADFDQRIVEFAPIAYALMIAPQALWEPLSRQEQTRLAAYLLSINGCEPRDNNWLFFRVLVNLALALRGAAYSAERMKADLARLESFYLGNGWYADGPAGQCDYYCGFAMQFYALLYTRFGADLDPARCARFRDRATEFSHQFVHWFTPNGPAVPYGRSLIYRFGQAAFWGALAFAGEANTPWGYTKGLLFRHLRWWMNQPIFSETGLITAGYTYPNGQIGEVYNSPASPYWALKSFLPIALPRDHPFWNAVEEPQPDLPTVIAQVRPRMILCRDRNHVFALAGGLEKMNSHRHAAEKYCKFSYSTQFGFSVPGACRSLAAGAHDSMLALSKDGDSFRVREAVVETQISERHIRSLWKPWPDLEVTTWLIPILPGYVRVHRIQSATCFFAAEGGFALDLDDLESTSAQYSAPVERGAAALAPAGFSMIRDLHTAREARVIVADPNTNILYPRSVIPTLLSNHESGLCWLACYVSAGPDGGNPSKSAETSPTFEIRPETFLVRTADGIEVFSADFPATAVRGEECFTKQAR